MTAKAKPLNERIPKSPLLALDKIEYTARGWLFRAKAP